MSRREGLARLQKAPSSSPLSTAGGFLSHSGQGQFVICFKKEKKVVFCPQHTACGILAPQPGGEPVPPALETWNINR